MRRLAIMGSTGSIGRQALEVIKAHPENFSCEVLTAQNNASLLIQQAIAFQPNAVVIGNVELYGEVKEGLKNQAIKVFAGEDSIEQIVEMETIDMVLASIVGFAGLRSTIHAIRNKKTIALANKETLVVAGALVTKLAQECGVNIIPVDSEHSAIFQCLAGELQNPIEKIMLTASGGPFRGWNKTDLESVTPEQALRHPNWTMGAKVTIDSATLMNKGLEVIEAHWLFNLKPSQIEVWVHPQSIVHSMVQFTDGSIKAQMGLPDMKLPIQYAFSYPFRLPSQSERFSFEKISQLTFEKSDTETFPNLALAYSALEGGGLMPCALNAANEIAVEAFLQKKISFLNIMDVVENALIRTPHCMNPQYSDYVNCNLEIKKTALEKIK